MRPATSRTVPQFPTPAAPDIIPQQVTLFVPPKGMNTQNRIDQLDRSSAALVQNLLIRDQHYIARDGLIEIGDAAGARLVYATAIRVSTGKTWLLRWRTDLVEYYAGGSWHTCAGVDNTYSIDSSAYVSATGWNDTLVFTVGVGHLYSIDFSSGTPTITELSTSPTGISQVTTFAGRIIASEDNTSSVYWCVKLDNTNWSGQGSGSEDFHGSPGGLVDQQTAVVPVTDEYAYVVRTNSVLQMTQTGDPDAPFRFTTLYQGVGSKCHVSVRAIRQGVAFLSNDSVIAITPNGLIDIGNKIRELTRLDNTSREDAYADYDSRNNEYVLALPSLDLANSHPVYRFRVELDGTVEVVTELYEFPIKSVAFIRYSQKVSIDELTGHIDDLPGTIDELSDGDTTVGLLFAMAGPTKRTVRNCVECSDESLRDVNSAGNRIAGGWRIESGSIVPDKSTRKVTLVDVEIEYEANTDTDLTFETSSDGGVTWDAYSTRTAPATQRPRILRVRRTLERESIQVAVSCDATPGFHLIAVHAYISSGADPEDTR